MFNAFVIVWRESLEAMLVLGILSTWVVRSRPNARRVLWGGVVAGIALALVLAALMQGTLESLSYEAQEGLQAALILFAALLMTHMVLWMSRHARGLRREIEATLDRASAASGAVGVAAVAALAVAREGAETVIFLQGVSTGTNAAAILAAGAAGFVAAALTSWAAARGLRGLSPQLLFRVSAALLLMFAAGFVVSGCDRLIGLEWLPPGPDPLWDTRALLDDASPLGKWAADLLGYRARPATAVVVAWCGYWSALALWHWHTRTKAPRSAPR